VLAEKKSWGNESPCQLRWLVVEDALRDRKGHWFEYINTFSRELFALGDEVTVLSDRAAEVFLVQELRAQPVLPASIWHRMGDGAGLLRRYLRVPVHAWQTYQVLRNHFQRAGKYDVVFVPTVLVHHLLGWVWLIHRVRQLRTNRTLLFFPNTPVQLNPETGEPTWLPSPTSRLFCRLIRSLKEDVTQGRVILGVETYPMQHAMTRLTGVPFTYFPHPVAPLSLAVERSADGGEIVMGSYGGARYEKGCDCLVAAVEEFCRQYPGSRARFVQQCVGEAGEQWDRLRGNPKVGLIPHYFADGEYAKQLRATQVLLLPYRRSSYALRVSRVVIEAVVNGFPVVATRGTTLASQAGEFGAAVLCDDGNVQSLVEAIHDMNQNFSELRRTAEQRKIKAIEHFSVRQFRRILLAE
jgi:glycosyltransferase involved in cell wall biosynthesis